MRPNIALGSLVLPLLLACSSSPNIVAIADDSGSSEGGGTNDGTGGGTNGSTGGGTSNGTTGGNRTDAAVDTGVSDASSDSSAGDGGPATDAGDAAVDAGNPSSDASDGALSDRAVADGATRDGADAADAQAGDATPDGQAGDASAADGRGDGGDGSLADASSEGSAGDASSALPSLIAYYPFEEGSGTAIIDGTANGNNGVHTGSYVAGKKGYALQFAGGTGYGAKVVGNAAFTWGASNADYTVEFWLQVTAPTTDYQSPFHKSDATGANCCTGTLRTPGIFFTPSSLSLISIMGTMAEANHYTGATPPISTAVWTHYATVHKGSQQLVYLNGVLALTDNLGSPTVGGTGVLYLAGDTFYPRLNGMIDEVRIYGVALTPAQIAQDMQ